MRIPKSFAAETLLEPDSEVDLKVVEDKLVVTPIIEPDYSLEQLLAGITKDIIHTEVDTGLSSPNN